MRLRQSSTLARMMASPTRRDFAFLLSERAIRTVFGVLLAGFIGRHLGTEAFGWLSYASAIMAVGTIVAQLGLDGIVVREIVQHPQKASEILGAAFLARLTVGTVVAAVLFFMAPILSGPNSTQRALLAILSLGTILPSLEIPPLWFQARTQSWLVARSKLVGFLIGVAVRLALLVYGAPVTAFAWTILVEAVVSSILVGTTMFCRGGRLSLLKLNHHVPTLIRDSWPLLVSGLAVTLYMRSDQVMLRWLSGADAVGIYSAATRLSEAVYPIPMLAATSTMAALAAAASSPARFDELIERYLGTSTALAYLIVAPTVFVAPWLLTLLFGSSFSGAGVVAQVHLLSVIFVFLGVARSQVLVVRGLTRFSMISTIAGGIANIGLNLLFIPKWGPTGAAVATLIAQGGTAVGATLLFKPTRSLGRQQLRALWRPRFRVAV